MRSFPSCWNKTLAQLGFKRKPRKRSKGCDRYRRRSLFESLEPRQMLAADLTVDTLLDTSDGGDTTSITTLINTPGSDGISLREAIVAANNTGGANTIEFATVAGTISLISGELEIDEDLTITGLGSGQLTIDGNDSSRIFSVDAGVNAEISGVTMTRGYSSGNAGAILNEGHLTLNQVVVSVSHSDQHGGAIYSPSGSSLQIDQSTFEGNSVDWAGGAINFNAAGGGHSSITNSTFVNNDANNSGAIVVADGSSADVVHISNSTFSENTSNKSGGAIRAQNSAHVELINSTVADNTVNDETGGGLFRTGSASFLVHNSIIVGNTATSNPSLNDADGIFDSASSYNLVGDTNFASELLDGNDNNQSATVADVALAPLDYYGGPTKTYALLPTSTAIGSGDTTVSGHTDQRGFDQVGTLDIGAFEYSTAPLVVTTTADSDVALGALSLRQAINLAATLDGHNKLYFDAPLAQ